MYSRKDERACEKGIAVTTTSVSLNPTEALARLESLLDLSMVRMKLADPEEGKGYSARELDLREREYRKFPALHLSFPEMTVVPCQMVDEFWHQHISTRWRTASIVKRSSISSLSTSHTLDCAALKMRRI